MPARQPPPRAASARSRRAQIKTARPRARASALVPSAGGSHEKPVRFDAARHVTTSSQRARPSAIRVASRPHRQPEPRVSTPGIGDEARSCGLNQGAPAGWLSIVCLGDYRRPGAIVVARRSIRRALNRQIRDSALNPATRLESFFAWPSDERGSGDSADAAATAVRNPARPARAFKTAIDAVTCSGPMS